MSLADLVTGRGPGVLDDGTRISAGQARRLACEAGFMPVVCGGKSEPLDVGRTRRLHTPAQRAALAVRDGGCTEEHCDWPPGITPHDLLLLRFAPPNNAAGTPKGMCHAHHDPSWASGGPTDVEHGRLLCPQHHRIAHDPRYTTTHLANGKIRFTRRT